MIHISYEDIKQVIKQEDLFVPVKQAFIDYSSPKLIGIPVNLLHFDDEADAHIKTAAIKGYEYFSIKVATMFPQNATRQLSPFNGAIFLFDAQTGEPKAILQDKGLLTDLRTAAAGALITNHVTPPSMSKVAVVGTGIQARLQVEAFNQLRPIDELRIWGRNQEKALALQEKLRKSLPKTIISLTDHIEMAVKESDIIITTTSSKSPLVKGVWLQKGQHITAVGADDTFKHELDGDCFAIANEVFLDSLELNQQYGEYAHLNESADLKAKTIEFGETFIDNAYTRPADHISIAKLVGVGVQDLAAATVVLERLHIAKQ